MRKLLAKFLQWFYVISIIAKEEATKEVYKMRADEARRRHAIKARARLRELDKQ